MEKRQEQPPSYDQSVNQGFTYSHPDGQAGYSQPQGYSQPSYPPQPQGYGQPVTKPYGYAQGYPQYGQQQQTSTVVVTNQPHVVVGAVRPQNWLIAAIFACLCFWPIGICAIIAANDSNRAIANNDYATAQAKANSARNLVIASFVTGTICYVIIVVVRVVVYSTYYSY